MIRAVAFHEAAVLELNEAVDFYNLECPGLGLTFLQEVQTALATIAQFPESTPDAFGGRYCCVSPIR